MQELTECMKDILRHAERAARNDEAKLKNIGWNARKEPGSLRVPGAPRTLEVKREGRGWVYLDWKTPADGAAVSAYRVLRRARGAPDWEEAGLCFESMTVLTGSSRPAAKDRRGLRTEGALREAAGGRTCGFV